MSQTSKTPWATLSLISLNLLGAFAVFFAPDILEKLVFDPIRIEPWSVITCLFVHLNVLHLLANMVFLAAVGPLVEFTRGGLRFITIYLSGGILGVMAHLAFSKLAPPGTPLLGASGAVASCIGYCVIRFARTKVPVFPKVGVPVALIGVVWIIIQGAGSFIQIGENVRGGTAYWSHLAGFLTGLTFAFIFGGLREARHDYGHEVLAKMNERGPAAVLAASEALLKQQPKNRSAQWERIQSLSELGETQKLAHAADQFIVQASSPELAGLMKIYEKHNLLKDIRSVNRLKYADRLAADFPEVQVSLLDSVAKDIHDPRRPDALVTLIELLPNSPERQEKIDVLIETYADHEATQLARQRGLIT